MACAWKPKKNRPLSFKALSHFTRKSPCHRRRFCPRVLGLQHFLGLLHLAIDKEENRRNQSPEGALFKAHSAKIHQRPSQRSGARPHTTRDSAPQARKQRTHHRQDGHQHVGEGGKVSAKGRVGAKSLGADTRRGSGISAQIWFREIPAQIRSEVLENSGGDSRRWPMKFRKIPMEVYLAGFRKAPAQLRDWFRRIGDEVSEGASANP